MEWHVGGLGKAWKNWQGYSWGRMRYCGDTAATACLPRSPDLPIELHIPGQSLSALLEKTDSVQKRLRRGKEAPWLLQQAPLPRAGLPAAGQLRLHVLSAGRHPTESYRTTAVGKDVGTRARPTADSAQPSRCLFLRGQPPGSRGVGQRWGRDPLQLLYAEQ